MNQGTWLTQDAYERLVQELAELEGPRRKEVVERIAAARDEGDLKENGGYHAAREEQGKLEGRILELKALLKNAVVGQAPEDDGVVEPGMLVTVQMLGKERTFVLGNRQIAEGEEVEVFSPDSPLGAAINGFSVGDSVEFTAPNGKEISVEIKAAKPFSG